MIDKQAVRIRRLITVIGKRTMTRQGIMAELDLSQAGLRNFRNNYLRPAMEMGFVRMVKPASPTSPEQAYALTQKGLDVL
jgi:ATP-dependent DNA helicase RecG